MNHILLDAGIILAVLGIVYAVARRDPATALAAILGALVLFVAAIIFPDERDRRDN